MYYILWKYQQEDNQLCLVAGERLHSGERHFNIDLKEDWLLSN